VTPKGAVDRKTYRRALMVFLGMLLAAGGVALLLLQLLQYDRDNKAHRAMSLGVYLVPALATLAVLVFGVRVVSLRLVITPEQLCVVGLVGSRPIPWASIDRFDLDRTRVFKQVCTIYLSTGERVHVAALPVSSPTERWATETIAELDRYLAERRGDA
jgi:Bacterial PH domain